MRLAVKQESFRLEVLMSRLQSECFTFCCKNLSSKELTMGEVKCVERCAVKYLQASDIINRALDKGESGGGAVKQMLKL
ncbi:hypothetical protein, conserved [Trypanosoma brucei gambiense DAL972]|uniref:Mitochondrial import inner membrane translocase subunit n=1 Tax=Trypanosoma brucei gambiense (strain MHOM/CI/86/DAL972) TaxID=679716 RepID=C9ZSE6_TRYB9|nr:hypothetical protein, conserved [Trypanosoma brucei gambiense DAL972]CBH12284.1 hypothetical protein, conserved [Trypanosoma brucei gambiense DAL972]|eukprot:XP_011774565.1 hypothetical protein, conserved [Trypanosoma brucei gambiense DAL972]